MKAKWRKCNECPAWYWVYGSNAKYCPECGEQITRKRDIIDKRFARIRAKGKKNADKVNEARPRLMRGVMIQMIRMCPGAVAEDCETCTVNYFCPRCRNV